MSISSMTMNSLNREIRLVLCMHSEFTLKVLDKLREENRGEKERMGRVKLVPLVTGALYVIFREYVALT